MSKNPLGGGGGIRTPVRLSDPSRSFTGLDDFLTSTNCFAVFYYSDLQRRSVITTRDDLNGYWIAPHGSSWFSDCGYFEPFFSGVQLCFGKAVAAYCLGCYRNFSELNSRTVEDEVSLCVDKRIAV